MKPTTLLISAGSWLLAGAVAISQEPPAESDLSAAVRHPDRVSFVMQADPEPLAGTQSTALTKIEIRKSGPVQHGIEHYANGTKKEWWGTRKFTASTAFVFGTGETVVAEMIDETDEEYEFSFFALETVPGLRWLRRAREHEPTTLAGKPCRYFVSASKMPDGVTPRGEVWVEEQTGRVLKLRNEDAVFLVEYRTPPEGELEVPPEFQKPVVEMAERMRRLNAIQNAGRR